MKRVLLPLLFTSLCCLSFVSAGAQGSSAAAPASPQAAAPVKDPVTAGLRFLLPRRRDNTLGAISAMPADKFGYKPTPEQDSFAHLVTHIIGFNNDFCAKAADVPAPKVDEVKDTDSKDKLLAAAKASFDFCGEALGKMDDAKLGDTIEIFGGRQGPRALAALIVASGWADHYATEAMYLRLNGILPPSAQPKK